MSEADAIDQMAAHLEFLGYEIERRDEAVGARHDQHFNIVLRPAAQGVIVCMYFGTNKKAKDSALHQFVNSLNTDAVIARYYIDGDRDFVMETWLPAAYERKSFGSFLEIWHHDEGQLKRHPDARNLLA